jgi:twitching motility protein PilT
VTGPTGSGKSTSLVAMLEEINESRAENLITIEDPIEYVFEPNKCIVSQREI